MKPTRLVPDIETSWNIYHKQQHKFCNKHLSKKTCINDKAKTKRTPNNNTVGNGSNEKNRKLGGVRRKRPRKKHKDTQGIKCNLHVLPTILLTGVENALLRWLENAWSQRGHEPPLGFLEWPHGRQLVWFVSLVFFFVKTSDCKMPVEQNSEDCEDLEQIQSWYGSWCRTAILADLHAKLLNPKGSFVFFGFTNKKPLGRCTLSKGAKNSPAL